jgi:hypothetical protein
VPRLLRTFLEVKGVVGERVLGACTLKGGVMSVKLLRAALGAGDCAYRYPCSEDLGVENMVGGVFCVFGIESCEECFCKGELAHVGGFQLVAQALRKVANAGKTVSWTWIRNSVFLNRRDRGDGVKKFLVQSRRIHTLIL